MKEIDIIFYANKNQSESLKRFIIINSFTANTEGIVLKGQYIRGIPFQDEINDTHYMIPGMMEIEILCKKASILSPSERKSSEIKLVVFSSGFLSKTYTLCFEDEKKNYYEIKCNDYYILKSEGFYNISGKYISVKKYRVVEDLKVKPKNDSFSHKEKTSSNINDEFWDCSFCEGNQNTGCLWNDVTECPRL